MTIHDSANQPILPNSLLARAGEKPVRVRHVVGGNVVLDKWEQPAQGLSHFLTLTREQIRDEQWQVVQAATAGGGKGI